MNLLLARLWIQLKTLAIDQHEIRDILREVEQDRLSFVAELIVALGVPKRQAAEKAKGFMYMFFGWLVLHWHYHGDPNRGKSEINQLLKILGLPRL